MTESTFPLVTRVETGTAYGGGRFGIVHANRSAPAGSLSDLALFFSQHGCFASPGYTGSEREPVLRLSGFASKDALNAMLADYAPWARARGGTPTVMPPATEILGEPLAHAEAGRGHFVSLLHRYASSLAGMLFLAADVNLVISGVKDRYQGANLKIAGALAYNSASVVLMAFGGEGAAKSTDALMSDLDRQLDHPARQSRYTHLTTYIRQHPWQIAGLFDMLGLGLQTGAALQDPEGRLKVIGLAGSMAGMAMQTFVPPRGEESILGSHHLLPEKVRARVGRAEARLERASPTVRSIIGYGRAIANHPVQAAGVDSSFANACGIWSEMRKKEPIRAEARAAGFCLAGNSAQMFAPAHHGPSLDDIASVASERLISRHADKATVGRAAHRLLEQSGLHVSSATMEKALTARMARRRGLSAKLPDVEEAVLADNDNPFVPSRLAIGGMRLASR